MYNKDTGYAKVRGVSGVKVVPSASQKILKKEIPPTVDVCHHHHKNHLKCV